MILNSLLLFLFLLAHSVAAQAADSSARDSNNVRMQRFTSQMPGNLRYVFCDLKRSLSQRQGNLTLANYRDVIDVFVDKFGCNGIRVHIDTNTPTDQIDKIAGEKNPESYTKLYRNVYSYARKRNLLIYANLLPLDGLEYGSDEAIWSANVARYSNYFCPDFVGPFNEDGNWAGHEQVAENVKKALNPNCRDPFGNSIGKAKIVGPDSGMISSALGLIKDQPDLLKQVDIVSSHNNTSGSNLIKGDTLDKGDRSASAADWKRLSQAAGGGMIWASEFAGSWDAVPVKGPHQGVQVGIKAALESGVVEGLVLYMAENLVNDTATDTNDEGKLISSKLNASGWPYPVKIGSDQDDSMKGTKNNDRIVSGAGNDYIHGNGGSDILVGGVGADKMKGDSGDDLLLGGSGNNELYGNDGHDKVFGGNGDEKIYGGAGVDNLVAGDGDDEIYGGTGADRIAAGSGADRVVANAGDRVSTGLGADTVNIRYLRPNESLTIDGKTVSRTANGDYKVNGTKVILQRDGSFKIGSTKIETR